jgi:hypothetical protein
LLPVSLCMSRHVQVNQILASFPFASVIYLILFVVPQVLATTASGVFVTLQNLAGKVYININFLHFFPFVLSPTKVCDRELSLLQMGTCMIMILLIVSGRFDYYMQLLL